MKFPVFTRIIALILSVLTIFYLLPARAYAAIGDDGEDIATVST